MNEITYSFVLVIYFFFSKNTSLKYETILKENEINKKKNKNLNPKILTMKLLLFVPSEI